MKLFEGDYNYEPISAHPTYDVSRDEKRFLMLKNVVPGKNPSNIRLVLNWFDELERRVPGGR